ncbi:MAG: MoaD/ThiS family protein [Pirellulales bacterium]|nr:MoaD/ThiS family protein [Pirellulales bacterium]
MNVQVRLFAAARQAAGRDRLELELPDGATIGQLRRRLGEELPGFSGLIARAMFAVDMQYALDAQQIPVGAEVALIPPVSGG